MGRLLPRPARRVPAPPPPFRPRRTGGGARRAGQRRGRRRSAAAARRVAAGARRLRNPGGPEPLRRRQRGPQAGTPGFVRGFLGGVAAEDPAAALVARNVLSAGGTAVDAAVAAGFAMAVTLPSRVGLGGGGACLVFDPDKGARRKRCSSRPARAPRRPLGADRPAAVPLLARGLFALHTRKPGRPFEELMAPAEQLARFGTEVGRGLRRRPRRRGRAALRRPRRARRLRRAGRRAAGGRAAHGAAGTGGHARPAPHRRRRRPAPGRRSRGAWRRCRRAAGGSLTLEELRAALPRLGTPLLLPSRGRRPGGVPAAAGRWRPRRRRVLRRACRPGKGVQEAAARGLGAVAGLAPGGRRPARAPRLGVGRRPAAGCRGGLPASAGLAVFDRTGTAVSCAFTLNNLFGTGRMAPGMGFLLAAAPGIGAVQPPLLAAGIAFNRNLRAFRMAAAGSGQEAAAHRGRPGRWRCTCCAGQAPAAALAQRLAGAGPDAARRLPQLPAGLAGPLRGAVRPARRRRGAGRGGPVTRPRRRSPPPNWTPRRLAAYIPSMASRLPSTTPSRPAQGGRGILSERRRNRPPSKATRPRHARPPPSRPRAFVRTRHRAFAAAAARAPRTRFVRTRRRPAPRRTPRAEIAACGTPSHPTVRTPRRICPNAARRRRHAARLGRSAERGEAFVRTLRSRRPGDRPNTASRRARHPRAIAAEGILSECREAATSKPEETGRIARVAREPSAAQPRAGRSVAQRRRTSAVTAAPEGAAPCR